MIANFFFIQTHRCISMRLFFVVIVRAILLIMKHCCVAHLYGRNGGDLEAAEVMMRECGVVQVWGCANLWMCGWRWVDLGMCGFGDDG